LNEFLVEKNVDKTKLNRRIDEYLVVQEKKIAEETCQNKINYEKELKKKNKVADDFKKRFINNLNDPSFNLEDEENSTKDLEMVEKSTTLRVQNSSEDVEDNYNVFKTYKDGLIEREKEKSNTSINIETEFKKSHEYYKDFQVKNSPKFSNFKNFIDKNDTKSILSIIKDQS